jgi:hypothetical protein
MHRIAVYIYEDVDFTERVGCYVASFGAVPRVGEYIKSHVRIKNAFDCRVEQVIVIPKFDIETTDVDLIIKALQVDDKKVEF